MSPATEVLSLIGAKEGIGHLPLALSTPATSSLFPIPPIRFTALGRSSPVLNRT